MIDRFFNVLLVDDEPDVLAVSKVTLRRMKLYGIPVRLHTADSKAAAIEFLESHPEGRHIALAIVDVVMETEHAGLELCAHIREDLGDHLMPLVIRTGQAGRAPERQVIDDYEITGYINKVEATEDRLYSLIKGGVRQYVMAAYEHYAGHLLHHLTSQLHAPPRAHKAVERSLEALSLAPGGGRLESVHADHCVIADRFYAGAGQLRDSVRGRLLRDRLLEQEGTPLSPTGDRMVVTDDHLLFHVEGSRNHPTPLESVWTIGAPPPPFVAKVLYMTSRQLQVLLNLLDR